MAVWTDRRAFCAAPDFAAAEFFQGLWPGDVITPRRVYNHRKCTECCLVFHNLCDGLHTHGVTSLVRGFDHVTIHRLMNQAAHVAAVILRHSTGRCFGNAHEDISLPKSSRANAQLPVFRALFLLG